MSANCRSCGAAIIWAETANGKRMPVDAEPVIPKGLFVLTEQTDRSMPPLATSAASLSVPRLFQSHFATCPNADEHRSTT